MLRSCRRQVESSKELIAFSVLMGVPKRASSGVFIGENAHRNRGIGYIYTETALATL